MLCICPPIDLNEHLCNVSIVKSTAGCPQAECQLRWTSCSMALRPETTWNRVIKLISQLERKFPWFPWLITLSKFGRTFRDLNIKKYRYIYIFGINILYRNLPNATNPNTHFIVVSLFPVCNMWGTNESMAKKQSKNLVVLEVVRPHKFSRRKKNLSRNKRHLRQRLPNSKKSQKENNRNNYTDWSWIADSDLPLRSAGIDTTLIPCLSIQSRCLIWNICI